MCDSTEDHRFKNGVNELEKDGQVTMITVYDSAFDRGRAEGREQGVRDRKRLISGNLIKNQDMTFEEVMTVLGQDDYEKRVVTYDDTFKRKKAKRFAEGFAGGPSFAYDEGYVWGYAEGIVLYTLDVTDRIMKSRGMTLDEAAAFFGFERRETERMREMLR